MTATPSAKPARARPRRVGRNPELPLEHHRASPAAAAGLEHRLHLRARQRPIEQVDLTTGTATYLLGDRLGSVRATVDSSGALTGTTAYDAWGNPQTPGGLTATTPFGYAGGYTDPTGLLYLIHRDWRAPRAGMSGPG